LIWTRQIVDNMPMKIEIVPAFELLGALLNYARRGDEEEDWIESSQEIINWRLNVEKNISPFLSSDIEHIFQCRSPYTLLVHSIIRHELFSPEELIAWLNRENQAEVQDLMVEVFGLEKRNWEEVDQAELKAMLEQEDLGVHVPVEEEVALILFGLRSPKAFMQRLVLVLSDFYYRFVEKELEDVIAKLESKRGDHQARMEKDAAVFLNQITLDNYESMYEEAGRVRVFLTYFANRFISLFSKKEPLILYGYDVDQLLTSPDVAKQTDQFIKALADPKRAAILRLLKRRQWYGKELADHFSLSTATMSYHMEKLISSRLVRFEMGEKKRVLYSINREGVKAMLESLQKDFL